MTVVRDATGRSTSRSSAVRREGAMSRIRGSSRDVIYRSRCFIWRVRKYIRCRRLIFTANARLTWSRDRKEGALRWSHIDAGQSREHRPVGLSMFSRPLGFASQPGPGSVRTLAVSVVVMMLPAPAQRRR